MPHGDRIDTVVLACTHFPLIAGALSAAFGPDVRLIDGADGIARRIASLTQGQQFERRVPDLALFTRDETDLGELSPALAACGLHQTAVF